MKKIQEASKKLVNLNVMVKREGRYFIPKGNTILKEDDKILMISDDDKA